jgi:hypothetical protein
MDKQGRFAGGDMFVGCMPQHRSYANQYWFRRQKGVLEAVTWLHALKLQPGSI